MLLGKKGEDFPASPRNQEISKYIDRSEGCVGDQPRQKPGDEGP